MTLSLRERALRYLAQRDHSRQELARKLARHASGEDELAEVMARLEELDLLSDDRYAQAFVRSRAARFGCGRLRQELARRGVDRDTIESALGATTPADEVERARGVWARKFAAAPGDAREWARQARFLQGRGFATEIIRTVLKDSHDEPA